MSLETRRERFWRRGATLVALGLLAVGGEAASTAVIDGDPALAGLALIAIAWALPQAMRLMRQPGGRR